MSDNPLVADPVDMSTPFSGAFVLEDIEGLVTSIQNNDWLGGTLSGVALAADTVAAVSDPIGSLIAHGLGWLLEHMEPLRGWFNDLAGDPGEVAGYAQTWANISQALAGSATDIQTLVRELDGLEGETIEAYRRFQADAAKHLQGGSDLADGISAGMQLASMAVKLVHDLARDALAELVGTAISAALELTVTLGLAAPLVIEQVATKAFSLVARVGKTITRLLRAMGDFGALIARAHRALDVLVELFQKALRRGDDAPTNTPSTPSSPDTPGSPGSPGSPNAPSSPDAPTTPGSPSTPDVPSGGGTPPGSVVPDTPSNPKPDGPTDGTTPDAPDAKPDGPDASDPDAPDPDAPDTPATPDAPPPMPDLSAIDAEFRDPSGAIPADRMDEWAEAVSEAYPTLTPTDVKALYGYTTSDYRDINTALRGDDPLTPAMQTRVDEISAALAKLPDVSGTTHRGVSMTPAELGMVEGSPWSDSAYVSSGDPFPGQTQITIEGTSGNSIEAISRYQNENEVLFDRNTPFDVVSITEWTDPAGLIHYDVLLREK